MKLITDRIDLKSGPYRCPWQSIHLITSSVPHDLRYDAVLSSKELLSVPLIDITNAFKMSLYKYPGKKQTDPHLEIDPNRMHYDGWTVDIHESFITEFGKKVRPFKYGFCIAHKAVIPGLWVVSIALTITSN